MATFTYLYENQVVNCAICKGPNNVAVLVLLLLRLVGSWKGQSSDQSAIYRASQKLACFIVPKIGELYRSSSAI